MVSKLIGEKETFENVNWNVPKERNLSRDIGSIALLFQYI